ncbi:MAG TPA: LPS assembly lipoprotein LptE, partial [Gemmatimonadaceae bacterium]|nr:LPS assembly lipoprotein LptE [Gemmatimonadaceae bacterium]
MPRSGFRKLALAGAIWLCALGGCFYGFAGGGLPSHVKTVAVLPFDNETTSPELQRELFELMRRELQGRLGLREASEARADAVVRGTIRRYETDVPIGFSADPAQATTARRQLQISVDVEIVDQTTGRTLWERKGLTADADYAERAEVQGRRTAIERLVRD